MNRIIEGTGVTLSAEQLEEKRAYWATLSSEEIHARTYTGYGRQLGLLADEAD